MSVIRTCSFIGVLGFVLLLSPLMLMSPLTANADWTAFVGQSDKGTINVKNCGALRKGKVKFANRDALNVGIIVGLNDGDGLDGDDPFRAVFDYGAIGTTPFFSGIWSMTNLSNNFVETYELHPDGDPTLIGTDPTAMLAGSGWEDLLVFMNEMAGQACNGISPSVVYPARTYIRKASLIVYPTPNLIGQKARLVLEIKAYMDGYPSVASDGVGSPKTDEVHFKYQADGYVYSAP